MEIARMNERITIEKNSVVVDKIGNHISQWTDFFSCYTYASTYEADESGDEVVNENRSVVFSVRWCRETAAVTSTGFRIRFHGDVYNIGSVDPMNYQRKEIKFHCRKEARQ
jgi:SPP1 family predicted phage head-tail adaptor